MSIVAAAAFSLPLAAAFAHPELSVAFKLLVAALIVAGAVRPFPALLALVLALPFAASMERLWLVRPTAAAITDALLLAFLAGASLRFARLRSLPPARLAAPVGVLLAAVLTSTLVELHAMQVITPRQPLVPELWRYLIEDYWTTPRQIVVLHETVRWLAWLTAAVYAERLIGAAPDREMVGRLWVIAGGAGAALTMVSVLGAVMSSELPPMQAVQSLVESGRFSTLQPDLNAAGSYFALFLLPAAVVGVRRRTPSMLAAALPLIALAFFAARSRAAVGAVVLVASAAGAQTLSRTTVLKGRMVLALAGLAVTFVALAAGLFAITSQSNVAPQTAVQYRLEMTQVAFEGVRRYPLFGVGLGDYIRTTRRFITPDMPLLSGYAPNGENAHNNFLQIAVELGVPAMFAFLWLVVPIATLGFRGTVERPSPELRGMSLGLAAFLLSALFGHPLLIAQVGAAFFMALGITAGFAPAPQRATWAPVVAVAGVCFYGVSLLWRVL